MVITFPIQTTSKVEDRGIMIPVITDRLKAMFSIIVTERETGRIVKIQISTERMDDMVVKILELSFWRLFAY